MVDDERSIADTLIYALGRENFAPLWVPLGQDALDRIATGDFALVILDIGLPDLNGLEVCRRIRRQAGIPVIFLTARGEEVDRIVGLEIGAEDYIVKPFSPREVVARVRSVLKRAGTRREPRAAGFAIDAEQALIRFRDVALTLTRYEYRLLAALIDQPQRVFSREALMRAAWEHDVSDPRTVDTHVKQLRAKLRAIDPTADPIRTHRGLGYSLSAD